MRGGVGLCIGPELEPYTLGFSPVDEKVASKCLGVGGQALILVCAYALNDSWEYPALLEWGGGAGKFP